MAAGLLILLGLNVLAQGTGQGRTADELYVDSVNAYNAGDYAKAIAGFSKFMADFGVSDEGKEAVGLIRYPLAMSHLHLQKFAEAMPAIQDALNATPPPTQEQREDLLFYLGVCQMQEEALEDARKTFSTYVEEFPKGQQVGGGGAAGRDDVVAGGEER